MTFFFLRGGLCDLTSTVDIEEIRMMESLRFDLHTIKAATQNFSRDNKLGQGGFGAVYKVIG